MRKLLCIFLVLLVTTFIKPPAAQAEIPARAKAFLTIIGYGTAGGALLGAASLAFGNSTRAVSQGASLGLYGGIIFASYILVSHHNRNKGSYDDDSSPYQESSDVYGEEYNSEEGGSSDEEEGEAQGGFFNRFESIHTKFQAKEKGSNLPPLKINIFQYNF